MTTKDLIVEIRHLSLDERLSLLEYLIRNVREEWHPQPRNGSSLDRVRGMLKLAGPIPTDAELADSHLKYLLEKYA